MDGADAALILEETIEKINKEDLNYVDKTGIESKR